MAFAPDGDALSRVLSEMRGARYSIEAALFYLSQPDLIETLCQRASSGQVRVRILTDAEAARPADLHILEKLAAHGVEVRVLPSEGGKMHLKCVVVDGATVITGAANWTPQAFELNIEDSLMLRSTELAGRYRTHFEGLFSNAQPVAANPGLGMSASNAPPANAPRQGYDQSQALVPGKEPEVFFSPGREGADRLAGQIMAATGSVRVAMYLLNDSSMRRVLVEKASAGTVPVQLIVNSGMLESTLRPVLQELAAAGVEITWWGDDRRSLHLKTAVIDGRYVWTGSANWTPSAFDRNVEDMLCVDSPELAQTYLAFLDGLRAECSEYQPAGQAVAEESLASAFIRDGWLVGLPPTGARTNWSDSLSKTVRPSFEAAASLKYLPDDQYFPALMDMIRAARQSILVAMFVFPELKPNESLKAQLVKALADAAGRGVYVYLLLHMPPGEGEQLARAHEDWAEQLRARGIDVRLHVPSVPLHAKLVVVDLAKILIGSHNWSEGALSGERVGESSALLVLPQQDFRWAEYVLSLDCVADMRSREHWQEELRRLRQLAGLRGKSKEAYLQQLEGVQ